MAEIETKCRCCGKQIDIIHPSQWAYKVKRGGGYAYFCTWKCLREDEKKKNVKQAARKEETDIQGRNNRKEVLKKLMAAAEAGRDIYEYLRGMGHTDPKDTLRRLRMTAKKEAPEIYRKMEKMGLLDLRKGNSGKGDKMSQNKLTRAQKEKAVEIAIAGGDPLKHLAECGAKNPSAAWWYIKKTLAEKNPKLLEKIPEKIGTVLNESGQAVPAPEKPEGPKVEIAEKLPPEAVAEVEVAETLPEEATITGEEKEQLDELTRAGMPLDEAMEEVKERLKGARVILGERHKTIGDAFEELAKNIQEGLNPTKKPVNYDGVEVVCIRGEFGEYRLDGRKFHFANAPKIMYIEMYKEDLAAFLDEIKRAAQILGVDAG